MIWWRSVSCAIVIDEQSTNSPVTESIEVTLSSPVALPVESDTQLKVGKEQLRRSILSSEYCSSVA